MEGSVKFVRVLGETVVDLLQPGLGRPPPPLLLLLLLLLACAALGPRRQSSRSDERLLEVERIVTIAERETPLHFMLTRSELVASLRRINRPSICPLAS